MDVREAQKIGRPKLCINKARIQAFLNARQPSGSVWTGDALRSLLIMRAELHWWQQKLNAKQARPSIRRPNFPGLVRKALRASHRKYRYQRFVVLQEFVDFLEDVGDLSSEENRLRGLTLGSLIANPGYRITAWLKKAQQLTSSQACKKSAKP